MLCTRLKIISGQTCRLETSIFKFTKCFTGIFYRPEHIFPDLSYTVSQYFMTFALMAVAQKVNNFEISVVVQELEFAMDLALYGLLWSLGNQYFVGSLSLAFFNIYSKLIWYFFWVAINYILLSLMDVSS